MKPLVLAAYAVMFAAFGLLALVGFWLFYPYTLFTAIEPLRVITKDVRAGELFTYEVDYCKYTNKLPTSVIRQLVDGYAYDLPESTSSNFPKGCHTVQVSVPLALPASVPAGKYYILVTGEYQVNPIRTWTYTLRSEDFNLIK